MEPDSDRQIIVPNMNRTVFIGNTSYSVYIENGESVHYKNTPCCCNDHTKKIIETGFPLCAICVICAIAV